MSERNKFIFDMDGTLYQFGNQPGQDFATSRFCHDLNQNIKTFFEDNLGLGSEEAMSELDRINCQYNGEVSLGIEIEYAVPRGEYFAATWNLDPSEYIVKNPSLKIILKELRGRVALLTAAPRVWAVKVLSHLDVEDIFEDKVFTGDPNDRKPDPVVFQKIVDVFNCSVSDAFSIGDQELTDILPAKQIGMKTVRIGHGETKADFQAEDIELALRLLKEQNFI